MTIPPPTPVEWVVGGVAWAVFFGGWLVRRWWRQAKAEDAEAIAAQQCADLGPPQE